MKKKSQSPVSPKKKEVGASNLLSFPDAIHALIGGASIRRAEWEDPTEYGILKDSFLMIHRNGKFHTWIVSEGDLLATDWIIL